MIAIALAFLSSQAAARRVTIEADASLPFLLLLGAAGARRVGASARAATNGVAFWGALAMAMTAGIGLSVGTAV